MVGLGQVYLRRRTRALFFFFTFASFEVLLCFSVLLASPGSKLATLVVGLAFMLIVYVANMLDAFFLARRLKPFEASRFNRFRWCFAFFFFGLFFLFGLVRIERLYLLDVYRITSTSMSPELRNGDYVVVNRRVHCADCSVSLCRGDIIVFETDGSVMVKRVAGLPGDQVEIENQTLKVNGRPATGEKVTSLGNAKLNHFHRSSNAFSERLGGHAYLSLWRKTDDSSHAASFVPPGSVFVLGDNRHHSKDSRTLGAIPDTNLRGRVEEIWFSADPDSGIRFERAGVDLSSSQCENTLSTRQAETPFPPDSGRLQSLPNLLIITIDTLRADHVGAYGYSEAKTPTIDGIAQIGVRFTNAMTPFPRTTPALASLFTGLWPQNHGSRDVGIPIKEGPTIAEFLKAQGYETLGVTSTALASHKQHFDRGFDEFDGRDEQMGQLLATDVTKRALKMVRESSRTSPQLLWVHYFDPHFPYEPPSGFPDQPKARACRQLIRNVLEHPRVEWSLHSNWGRIAERTRSECIDLYDSEIHYVDTEIARLLYGLNTLGFLQSVVIAITSDHGESFGESGTYYEHGSTVNDSVLRIPLVIAAPGVGAYVEPTLFSLEDLMPTLLGLLDIHPSARPIMDGRDYSARLREPTSRRKSSDRLLFSEGANTNKPPLFALPFDAEELRSSCVPGQAFDRCRRFGGAGELLAAIMGVDSENKKLPEIESVTGAANAINARFRMGEARQRSVRTRDFKLVQAPRVYGGVQRSLFELLDDPAETKDVSSQYPEISERLGGELDRWLANLPSVEDRRVDPEDVDVLRRLGYIE